MLEQLGWMLVWVVAFVLVSNTIGVSVQEAWRESRLKRAEKARQLKSYFKD